MTVSPPELTLDTVKPGRRAEIVRVAGGDRASKRLIDLGFWPHTAIEVVRRAPFGDPTEYRLQGYRIALRRDEARKVVVRATDAAATPIAC